MTPSQLLRLNLEEVRRRSVILWSGIPPELLAWRPDPQAMSCIEMVRHVLESDAVYLRMIEARRSVPDEPRPFGDRPPRSVSEELALAAPHRDALLRTVSAFTPAELEHER